MTRFSAVTYLIGNRRRTRRKKYRSQRDTNKLQSRSSNLARELTNDSPNAVIQRTRIPKSLIHRVEKGLDTKFKQLPAFYVCYPKKGHMFRKPRKGEVRTMAITDVAIKKTIRDDYGRLSQPIKYVQYKPIIMTHKAFMKNKHLRNIAIIHELGEALAFQNETKWKATHGWASKLDQDYMREHNLTESKISTLIRKYYPNPENWK
jgi:hypothetical protein